MRAVLSELLLGYWADTDILVFLCAGGKKKHQFCSFMWKTAPHELRSRDKVNVCQHWHYPHSQYSINRDKTQIVKQTELIVQHSQLSYVIFYWLWSRYSTRDRRTTSRCTTCHREQASPHYKHIQFHSATTHLTGCDWSSVIFKIQFSSVTRNQWSNVTRIKSLKECKNLLRAVILPRRSRLLSESDGTI